LRRLIKTLYLLRFFEDDAYRRRILVQINSGEGRHQLARIVFHGKRGEVRQRYREGQEDRLAKVELQGSRPYRRESDSRRKTTPRPSCWRRVSYPPC
jgi:hypothetical protein